LYEEYLHTYSKENEKKKRKKKKKKRRIQLERKSLLLLKKDSVHRENYTTKLVSFFEISRGLCEQHTYICM
jgi:transposase